MAHKDECSLGNSLFQSQTGQRFISDKSIYKHQLNNTLKGNF